MSGISLRVVRDDLGALAAALGQAQADAFVVGLRLEATWKQGVRVKTGTLRRSIHTTADAGGRVVVGTDLAYAAPENYGTRRMAGSFAREKAIERHKGDLAALVRRRLSP